jgi:hypothetical protein
MLNKFKYLLILLVCVFAQQGFAQFTNPNQQQQQQTNPYYRDTTTRKPAKTLTGAQLMDSMRKKEENKKDSVIFTAKFIRVTNEQLLTDSTQVLPLDTGLVNFENYSPLYQPKHPTIGLGNLGLAQRSLLFEPPKRIGFDVGLHFLDAYMLNPEDLQYYKARVPYTNLQLYASGHAEQYFKAVISENINPQLNIGANFNIIGSQGFYTRQNVSHLNAALFSWYESKGKRYNLLTNLFFNNLKTPENGSILNDTIFKKGSFDPLHEPVRLVNAKYQITNNGFYLKQFYYIGHIDSASNGKEVANILPTQRVAHTFMYNKQSYVFTQVGADTYKVFPDYYFNSVSSRDSLALQDIHNEFSYSFYLRPKTGGLIKNEVKLDLGLIHDLYNYKQYVNDSVLTVFGKVNDQTEKQSATFQNITLKAKLSYKFSNKVLFNADFQQIAQGRNFGDYLYDVKFTLAGNNKTGRIILGGYAQNNAPALVDASWISNHYIFHTDLKNQKTDNVSFNYINDALDLNIKAEYFLINDYIYFKAQPGGIDATPSQISSPINLLKVSIGKNLTWRRFHFDNYVVYQKTDYQSTLRTPEVYTYSNLYYGRNLFDAIDVVAGVSVRYNTPYVAPSYAIGIGQFYNGTEVTFNSYPYATVYLKATLQRTNLFVMYDYANQGLQSDGFYTVNRYPMQSRLLKFGVSWTFYN